MELKQNQTFYRETYSNLTPYLSLLKTVKIFQRLSKLKFLSFKTKLNPNNGNEAKSDVFPWGIFKSDTISFFIKKTLKYFNDFQN